MIHERKNGKTKSIQAAGAIVHKQARKPKLTYSDKLINEIREMIETSRARVAQTVNVGMTMLYWQIGCRIHRDILKEKRAEYRAEIVASLSRQLVTEYGNRTPRTRQIRYLKGQFAVNHSVAYLLLAKVHLT